MEKGILYIATAEEYTEEAQQSAVSVRESNEDLQIALITDQEDVGGTFDEVIDLPHPDHCNVDKVSNLHRSPYDKILYLDTDTYLCRDLRPIFDYLE